MELEHKYDEQVRRIFLSNECKGIKEQFKTLRDIALKSNPYDKCVIEYLEDEFYRSLELFIEKASRI